MVKKSKAQIKKEQANMQSDNIEMSSMSSDGIYTLDDWSMGATNVGSVTDTATVNFGDIGDLQMNFDYDKDLRDKYPALKDAWDHYNNVKKMCEAKEQENED